MENVTLNDLIIQNNGMPGYWNWLMDNGGWATMSDYQEEKAEFVFNFMQMDMPNEPIDFDESEYSTLFEALGMLPTHIIELQDDQSVYSNYKSSNDEWKGTGGVLFAFPSGINWQNGQPQVVYIPLESDHTPHEIDGIEFDTPSNSPFSYKMNHSKYGNMIAQY